ncbi:hypothetical protein M2454_002440 [Aequitasia blattaphilus]|uniref:DUF4176 domain-containing protein n=1 Tax=Aequitasia blattaphilus TaxID=2949332 RepID=A0ABT1EB67_9FIRM|nr:DUF4176 domain-containing protein [Aequitasia blattaphilus]MCP1103081.1 DUF4176 domain-containing protein [Aequitasia blattaphilus]MCR8615721.1 DUF4176 domain-containing protein [Aequitasia blattaphilus]
MKAQEYRMNLWNEFLGSDKSRSELERGILKEIGERYSENIGTLLKIYEAFVEKDRFYEDEGNHIRYEREGEDYYLIIEDQEVAFAEESFRHMLVTMLDIMEDTLPLGTVVDLRKEIYQAAPDINKVDHIRMVITHRFLGEEGKHYYFPYGAVVYPTGMLGQAEIMYFTRAAVQQIVRKGYRDEEEDGFVYLMKQDLILNQGKSSFGYAQKEEIEAFNRKVKKEGR